jgi:hypothetical protein
MKEVTETDWVEIDEALVTNKPFLTQYDIDMTNGVVGLTYAIRMTV